MQILTFLSRTKVTMRPIKPADVTLIQAMHERLSPRSVYTRYLRYSTPPTDDFQRLVRLGQTGGAAFVATVQQPHEEVIGLAYYVVQAGQQVLIAEPALLIEDQYQGQGVGSFMFRQLCEHAQSKGVYKFIAHVDASNRAMLSILRGSGFPVEEKAAYGVDEVHMRFIRRHERAMIDRHRQ